MRVIHDHSTLAIPTANPLLSSGFAYHPALIDLNISPGDWTLFTQALQSAAAPTPDQTFLTVLSGVVTVCLIGEPWTATCVARAVRRRQTVNNALRGLQQEKDGKKVYDRCARRESIGAVLKLWNEYWRTKSVMMQLEVSEKGEVEGKDVSGQVAKPVGIKNCCWCEKVDGRKKCCSWRNSCEDAKVKKKKCSGVGKNHFRILVQRADGSAIGHQALRRSTKSEEKSELGFKGINWSWNLVLLLLLLGILDLFLI